MPATKTIKTKPVAKTTKSKAAAAKPAKATVKPTVRPAPRTPKATTPTPITQVPVGPTAPAIATTTAPAAKRASALDAAARVLAEAGGPMDCKAVVAAMAVRGYWTSPRGRTPHATLSAAVRREIAAKGDAARFVQAGRGLFARRAA